MKPLHSERRRARQVDELLDLLKQAKSALDWLATADLSEDDLAVVVPTVNKFFDAVLRKQCNA